MAMHAFVSKMVIILSLRQFFKLAQLAQSNNLSFGWLLTITYHLGGFQSAPSLSTILFAIFAFMCLQKVLTAASTVPIFSASSFGMSNPKYSSIATTNSTESSESNPSSQKEAVRLSLVWLHLAADLSTWNTLASTSSRRATWVGSEEEVKEKLGRQWGKERRVKVVAGFVSCRRVMNFLANMAVYPIKYQNDKLKYSLPAHSCAEVSSQQAG